MTISDQATPGPWKTESGLPYGRQPRVYGADKSLVAVVGNAAVDQDRWEANASLIVRAVNAHDDMKEALFRLKTECEIGGLADKPGFDCWIILANKSLALSQANGGEE